MKRKKSSDKSLEKNPRKKSSEKNPRKKSSEKNPRKKILYFYILNIRITDK